MKLLSLRMVWPGGKWNSLRISISRRVVDGEEGRVRVCVSSSYSCCRLTELRFAAVFGSMARDILSGCIWVAGKSFRDRLSVR